MDKPIILYSTTTCSDCVRTKRFLNRHRINYVEYFLEDDDILVDKVLGITNGASQVPVVVLPGGSVLIEPTDEVLEKELQRNDIIA